jgi:hypothetical protein
MFYIELFGVIASYSSQQEDTAVNNGCQPFEKSRATSVPALERTSSRREHARSIGAESRWERPVLEKEWICVRSGDLTRNARCARR